MTLTTLAAVLAPIARQASEGDASDATDRNIYKVAAVLNALLACIEEPPVDTEALDALAATAGRIAEHRLGYHHP